MVLFPINWEIPGTSENFKDSDQVISELTLNKEWKIAYLRRNNVGKNIYALEISRKTSSTQMLVTGIIFVDKHDKIMLMQDFFKLIEPGSSSENLCVMNGIRYPYKLGGIVFITSPKELSGNNECKKCQPLLELSTDFVQLLDQQTSHFTDVNLKCGDVLIPAHKNILSARSPVFAAMFANEMKENHTTQVDITDMEPPVVREMLIYMYSGITSSLTVSLASGLLFAADKYHLDNLKKVCSDFLKTNIEIPNAISILILGDMHAEDLKSFAEDFICNKCPDFSVFEETEEWKIMRKEKPHLTVDILTSLMKLKNKKPEVNGGTIKSRDGRRKFPSVKNLFKSGMFHRFG